jgi:serine/threonine protein kinase
VHDIGEERVPGRSDSIHFIAMELIDGATLREVIDGGAIEIRKGLGIMLQVAEALTAAHAAGIVHRDLKPENIMVLPSGYAKVLDFGLAKLRAHPEGEVSETVETEIHDTDPGTIIGTSSYMAPEQALGKPVDHRADIFSFGSILHELVTGQRPFSGHSLIDTLHRIIYSDPEPISAHRTGVPRDLVRIVRKALAKEPDDRYQTMRDVAIDLRELIRELERIRARRPGERRRDRGGGGGSRSRRCSSPARSQSERSRSSGGNPPCTGRRPSIRRCTSRGSRPTGTSSQRRSPATGLSSPT